MSADHVKIAMVAIAKDEESRVLDWAARGEEADEMMILDTGSSDYTVETALVHGVTVFRMPEESTTPFRFDTARNMALRLVPAWIDYVFWMDMDELPETGWQMKFRDAILEFGNQEVFSTTRLWGDLAYERPTIHRATEDWYWRRPVHEELVCRQGEYSPAPTGIQVRHDQDITKDRAQYLPLMALAVGEDQTDTQVAFWYARELMYHGDYTAALAAFRNFCSMDNAWVIERMQAHLHMADIFNTISPGSVMQRRSVEAAIALAPWRREPLLAAAKYHASRAKLGGYEPTEAQDHARRALSIPHNMRPQDYLTSDATWDDNQIRSEYHIV